ncbi:MAG TPA: type I methionyl aminopeptidase [Actinomycetota bacterium]|nr:type I methionyl aminopeptidase [Actinomycetota bacterium]
MIILKSPEELEKMARAGRIVASTRERTLDAVRSGITTGELDAIAEKHIRSNGAVPSFKGYRGFPRSICASVNEELVHGIPGDRALREGDLLSLDFGAIWEGYHADSAVTVFVGGVPPSGEAEKLVRVTEEALEAGLSQVREGGRLSDIGHAVQQVVEGAGFGVVREYVGHGIGQRLHEDPPIPNYGDPGRGPELRPGMALAIEPMVTLGDWATRVLDDGWTVVTEDGSLCAHFEHTIVLTGGGPRVLTAA